MEVKTRCKCGDHQCEERFEYWSWLSADLQEHSDSYGGSHTSIELQHSEPDVEDIPEGWTREGAYHGRYFCPKHPAKGKK